MALGKEFQIRHGWAVVQLDYDKEEESWYVIDGPILAELDVERTIKRAELRASTVASAGTVHTN